LKRLARLIATWFYCGYFPKAPGTAGSLAAVAIAWILHEYAQVPAGTFAILAIITAVPGIWAARMVAREFGREDPQIVVVDEVIGQWITLAGAARLNLKSWIAAFVLFRLFDMVKPPPVRQCERFPEGCGIVADDVAAGIYGALVLLAAGWFNLY
jgi:phosphatidylglycerophosphatase A